MGAHEAFLSATKSHPRDTLGLGESAPAAAFLPAWGGLGSPGTSQTLQVQQLLSVAWKSANAIAAGTQFNSSPRWNGEGET